MNSNLLTVLESFFETRAMKSMKLLNVKILMGHDTGLEKSCYKPTEQNKNYWRII